MRRGVHSAGTQRTPKALWPNGPHTLRGIAATGVTGREIALRATADYFVASTASVFFLIRGASCTISGTTVGFS